MDDFHRALLEAVDEGLLQISEKVKTSFYAFLEDYRGLKREEIPFKLEEFTKGLRLIFGEGADIVLKWIARALYAKLGLAFEEKPEWTFKEYVEYAKKSAGVA
ncbi:MAG: hypothetical protein QW542_07705 [Thermoproteota archaeon]